MNFDDVKDMDDLASSADQLDVTDAETLSDDANSSVAAPSVDAEDDTLSVVRDVVQPKETTPEAEASQAEGEEVGEPEAPAAQDDENFSDVPFGKHPRFKQLLNERNAYKADAQQYRNVQNFMDQHGLQPDEAADGLIIMSLMKTNPVEAWARLKPHVQKLLVASGEVLPDDLKAMVQRGEIAPNAAMEVSRSRAAVTASQTQRQFEQQRAEQAEQRAYQESLASAANTWEAERHRADPNFEAKKEAVYDRVIVLQAREGRPTTPQGVREQCERAYREVNSMFATKAAPAAPARAPITPVRGGQVAGNQAPVGGSTMDIVNAVLARRGS